MLDNENPNVNESSPAFFGASMLEELTRRRALVETRTPAALVKAYETTEALLTPAWRFMLGEAEVVVENLIRRVLESREIYEHDGEHIFMTYEDLALMIGMSKRTVERYLSPLNKGSLQ